MKDTLKWVFKNLHLIISVLIVVPTAIIYGSPSILEERLDIQVGSIDLANLLKAIMCLYLGTSLVWIMGIWKPRYWKSATQLNILFMLSLAIGRTISIMTDGLPTDGYIYGLIAEYILGLFSIYQLKKYSY
tara:strand:- start:1270 stop:1662 length:393 start_codon:yes stop_codon:yes gene_type:complete